MENTIIVGEIRNIIVEILGSTIRKNILNFRKFF